MNCKLCNKGTEEIFQKLILNKYLISYFKCNACQFIQTEEPYWLDESYSNHLSAGLDVGAVMRNLSLSEKTSRLILNLFSNGRYIDYGGGTGLFVRLMRDKGFDFYWYDLYSDNIFAKYFALKNLSKDEIQFQLLTAFEVFEHLVHPMTEIAKMLLYSNTIFLSTEFYPPTLNGIKNWWYLVPEGGQHISLYSERTLAYIAKDFGLNFYTNGNCFHLLTKEKLPIPSNIDKLLASEKLSTWHRMLQLLSREKATTRESLIEHDFEFAKRCISQKIN